MVRKNESTRRTPERLGVRLLLAGFTIASSTAALAAAVEDYRLDWYTVDGGGSCTLLGGSYRLGSTVGQAEAAEAGGGDFVLTGGFWVGAVVSRPRVVVAESCRLHAEGMPSETELCIDLIHGNAHAVEPRLGGVTLLRIGMDEALDLATVIDSNVQIDCRNQTASNWTVTVEGPEAFSVSFPLPLADEDCCRLTFEGMQSAQGGMVTGEIIVTTLEGDMDLSAAVTGGDALLVKPHFGEIMGVDLSHPKWDFNRSGGVTGGDYALIKPRFGHVAPVCP